MLETPHVAIAAAIAFKIGNPVVALPLAFGSHFILEKIPHWNPHINSELKKFGKISSKSTWIIIIDAVLSLIVGFFIASRTLPDIDHFILILLASFFGVLPDLIEFPYYFMKFKNKYMLIWVKFQKSLQEDTTLFWGLLNQFIVILAAFWWILG